MSAARILEPGDRIRVALPGEHQGRCGTVKERRPASVLLIDLEAEGGLSARQVTIEATKCEMQPKAK